MDIKPIETVYNGYRFRSRLEARWEVVWNALGIKEREYEPQGFILPSGKCYLPDWKIKCYGVRGWSSRWDIPICSHCRHCRPVSLNCGDMASWFDGFCEYSDLEHDYDNPPIWLDLRRSEIVSCLKYEPHRKPFDLYIEVKGYMTQEDAEKIKEFAACGNPILVVGNIPPLGGATDSFETRSYEGMNGTDIYPFNYQLIDGDYFAAYPSATKDGKFYLAGDDGHYINEEDKERMEEAYAKARQARFEHGEKGG